MAGAPPSDEDRLKAIRAHADVSMRYYVTAFLRETEENRELMQAYMAITANILALLDGDALDDRSMMTGREEIIQQYIKQARSDPYEPGNCSFCGERPVAAWFEGPSFQKFVRNSADVRADEAWLACSTCLTLVEADDRDGLVRRGATREGRSWSERAETMAREMQNEGLLEQARSGVRVSLPTGRPAHANKSSRVLSVSAITKRHPEERRPDSLGDEAAVVGRPGRS